MTGRLARTLCIFGASTIFLASCTETVTVSQTSSDSAWQAVSANAKGIGATAQRVDATTGVVNYSGGLRDFATCSANGASVDIKALTFALDSRTTLRPLGGAVRAETLYVATYRTRGSSSAAVARSVSFGRDTAGQFGNGVTCRATGMLEKTLLGQG